MELIGSNKLLSKKTEEKLKFQGGTILSHSFRMHYATNWIYDSVYFADM